MPAASVPLQRAWKTLAGLIVLLPTATSNRNITSPHVEDRNATAGIESDVQDMSRKPAQIANFETSHKQLQEQGDRLRSEFVRLDLEAASTFLDLARFDFAQGETDHAESLVSHAAEAADTIERFVGQLSENDAAEVLGKLEVLRSQIANLQAK
ncbi:MAG: hypothetical protein C5B58_02850 [Acidobacteria bacterium]|nr:MAG: hypothetical protein C5B58_02850 [Acidobacteriota bacterium]